MNTKNRMKCNDLDLALFDVGGLDFGKIEKIWALLSAQVRPYCLSTPRVQNFAPKIDRS